MADEENKEVQTTPDPTAQFELYRQVLKWLFLCTLWIVLLISVLLLGLEIARRMGFYGGDIPILAIVALAGALGALFSAVTRLYSLHQLPSALLTMNVPKLSGNYLLVLCLVPPLVGMIGAVFFYVLIASGIVSSELFQHFHCGSKEGCEGMGGLLSYSPIEPTDYAKSLIWGFTAGFSERLVPDVLARLDKTSFK